MVVVVRAAMGVVVPWGCFVWFSVSCVTWVEGPVAFPTFAGSVLWGCCAFPVGVGLWC